MSYYCCCHKRRRGGTKDMRDAMRKGRDLDAPGPIILTSYPPEIAPYMRGTVQPLFVIDVKSDFYWNGSAVTTWDNMLGYSSWWSNNNGGDIAPSVVRGTGINCVDPTKTLGFDGLLEKPVLIGNARTTVIAGCEVEFTLSLTDYVPGRRYTVYYQLFSGPEYIPFDTSGYSSETGDSISWQNSTSTGYSDGPNSYLKSGTNVVRVWLSPTKTAISTNGAPEGYAIPPNPDYSTPPDTFGIDVYSGPAADLTRTLWLEKIIGYPVS